MFLVYRAEAEIKNMPIANFIIIGLSVLMFVLVMLLNIGVVDSFVLYGYNLHLMSHIFMHADIVHLIGNMLFLWIFGNAICCRVGSATYPMLYLTLGVMAGLVHLYFDGTPGLGASGAINGIIGMYLFLFPTTKLNCMWTIPHFYGEKFKIRAFWLIGAWFIGDVVGAWNGVGNIAYLAHIGGFVSGIFMGWLLLKLGWLRDYNQEKSLLAFFR